VIDIPVIGSGGISSAEDAIEFIIGGASAIQIGTYNFINPWITLKAIGGIEAFLIQQRVNSLSSLIGKLEN